jgi:KUP system potassium uptake protein
LLNNRGMCLNAIDVTRGNGLTPKVELRGPLPLLMIGALGVVYGDIGTSPLYTFKTALDWAGGGSTGSAPGMFSLIVWTLIITTSIKYVGLVMRADNQGEGGILALTARLAMAGRERRVLIVLGILGASLLYGDGAITPAISVLSALEGLNQPLPSFAPYVLPMAVLVLLSLFALQRQGTAVIGKLFGPIMIVWFVTIGVLGLVAVAAHPAILAAVNPLVGTEYLATHGFKGFTVLGAVFLSATGAEALYADMGHFGARPIRVSWYGLVLPTLLLNYAGQAALVASGIVPEEINPFFALAPVWLQLPLVGLATVATIIASQSIISGVFSMTRQAIQLGLCPRLKITQTSSQGYGQIYVGSVNWILMVFTVVLAIGFGSSENLAAAFGIAVSMTMLLTTILLFKVITEQWHWPLPRAVLVIGFLALVDIAFVLANLTKVLEGGWVPLVAALLVFLLFDGWRAGRRALVGDLERSAMPLAAFIQSTADAQRVTGTAIYLSRETGIVPTAMLHSVKHYHVLHERNVILVVETIRSPRLFGAPRMLVESLGHGFYRATMRFGFFETQDVPAALLDATFDGQQLEVADTSFFMSRADVVGASHDKRRVNVLFRTIFILLHRNESDATEFFDLPRNRVVELGTRVTI